MKDQQEAAFAQLFKEACQKCFGYPLTTSLSEADSKILSTTIFEQTGLVIGVKSIKNYSQFVVDATGTKKENPSVATLDTFARYVLQAPYTDEVTRKDKESHYPYWYQYKTTFAMSVPQRSANSVWNKRVRNAMVLVAMSVALVITMLFLFKRQPAVNSIQETFSTTHDDSLKSKGWIIENKDTVWWNRRGQLSGCLTLFTLRGDNWPGTDTVPIKNLLVHEINMDCFTTEIHLIDFFPKNNWQQAGILVSEDATFRSKVLRISLSYNDFFGGYQHPPEIIVQALSSSESGPLSKPEEIAHHSLFNLESGEEILVENNLKKSALKIEKKGKHYRLLFSTGSMESFAFKEVANGDFNLQPRYIGLFAIQGLSTDEKPLIATFDSFNLSAIDCDH